MHGRVFITVESVILVQRVAVPDFTSANTRGDIPGGHESGDAPILVLLPGEGDTRPNIYRVRAWVAMPSGRRDSRRRLDRHICYSRRKQVRRWSRMGGRLIIRVMAKS